MIVAVELEGAIAVTLFPFFLGAKALIYAFSGMEVNLPLIVEVSVVRTTVVSGAVGVGGGHESEIGN